jgi:thioredoxin 1
MAQVVNTNSNDFKEQASKGIVLVDFYADWCGPCRMLSPILDQVAAKYDGKVKVLKVNVDQNQELAMQYKVRSIPQMFVLKDGERIDSMLGIQTEDSISAKLNAALV